MSTSETVRNAARELYADSGISSTVSEGLDNIDRLARIAEREKIVGFIRSIASGMSPAYRGGLNDLADAIAKGQHT